MFTFDDDAIVCTHIADRLGHDSSTMHLRRQQDDGIVGRYTSHVEYLWDQGTDIT